jgi:hypothetical protein
MDEPTDDEVEAAIREYDSVRLVDLANTPEEVTL